MNGDSGERGQPKVPLPVGASASASTEGLDMELDVGSASDCAGARMERRKRVLRGGLYWQVRNRGEGVSESAVQSTSAISFGFGFNFNFNFDIEPDDTASCNIDMEDEHVDVLRERREAG